MLLGYSDELAEAIPDDSPLRKPVVELRHAAERASGLTKALVAFSRRQVAVTQAGGHNLLMKPFTPDMLVRRINGMRASGHNPPRT